MGLVSSLGTSKVNGGTFNLSGSAVVSSLSGLAVTSNLSGLTS
jgi:hypothetical protein